MCLHSRVRHPPDLVRILSTFRRFPSTDSSLGTQGEMVVHFPVPRSDLPVVRLGPEEEHVRRVQMQRMLESLIEEYERYVQNGRHVDLRRWKPGTSRDRLQLFKERSSAEVSGSNGGLEYDCRADAGTTEMRRAVCAGVGRMPVSFSEEGADLMKMTLMVGECPGRMENAMFAVLAADQSELAMVDIFLHDDVADCAILHTMDGPKADDPYHFLGYKWFVRKSPTTSHIVKHRDSVYIEYSGLTKTRSGDEIGYHIMHSVDLVGFPEMNHRNCVRTSQSIRSLYKQRPGNMVEVFSFGNINPAGRLKGALGSMLAQETLFNMPKLIECGESKRLARMMNDLREVREERVSKNSHVGESCALCRHKKKMFGISFEVCNVCGLDVCGKCHASKRIFRSEGILGNFSKIICCKACVLAVTNAMAHGTDLRPTVATALPASGPKHSAPQSIRSLAEQLEIRRRSTGQARAPMKASTNVTVDVSDTKNFGRLLEGMGDTCSPRDASPVERSPAVLPAGYGSILPMLTTHRSRTESIVSVESSYLTPAPIPSSIGVATSEPASSHATAQSVSSTSQPARASLSQAELYSRMLELQRKAQDAYVKTQQNQQYMYNMHT